MQDSHAHLSTQPLYNYLDQSLENFVQKGGKYILNIASDIESSYKVIEVYKKYEKQYPGLIQNSIGIHPEQFYPENKLKRENTEILKEILENNKNIVHAIGETGLQYYNLLNRSDVEFDEKEETIELQKESFRAHIHLAMENNLPICIHIREEKDSNYCTKDTLEIVTTEGKLNLKGVMHSYVGEEKFLQNFLELGFYIGFNGILTYKSGENVRELLKKTPMERILLETDAPYLPTQKVRSDKKNSIRFGQPIDIYEIAQTVAEIKDISIEKVLKNTTENYKSLFNIS